MYLKWLVFQNKLSIWLTAVLLTYIEAFVENRDGLFQDHCFSKTKNKLKEHPLPEDPHGVLFQRLCEKAARTSSALERIERPDPEYIKIRFTIFLVILFCTSLIYICLATGKWMQPIGIVLINVIAILILHVGAWLRHWIVIGHLATLEAAIEFLEKRDQRPKFELNKRAQDVL